MRQDHLRNYRKKKFCIGKAVRQVHSAHATSLRNLHHRSSLARSSSLRILPFAQSLRAEWTALNMTINPTYLAQRTRSCTFPSLSISPRSSDPTGLPAIEPLPCSIELTFAFVHSRQLEGCEIPSVEVVPRVAACGQFPEFPSNDLDPAGFSVAR